MLSIKKSLSQCLCVFVCLCQHHALVALALDPLNYLRWNGLICRAPDSCSKGLKFKTLQEQWENFLLQGQLSVLTLVSVSFAQWCYCRTILGLPGTFSCMCLGCQAYFHVCVGDDGDISLLIVLGLTGRFPCLCWGWQGHFHSNIFVLGLTGRFPCLCWGWQGHFHININFNLCRGWQGDFCVCVRVDRNISILILILICVGVDREISVSVSGLTGTFAYPCLVSQD